MERRLSLYRVDAGLEPANNPDTVIVAPLQPIGARFNGGAHHHRDPHVGREHDFGSIEMLGCDADHCEGVAIEGDGFANYAGIGAKTPFPAAIAEDRNRMRAGRAVLFGKKRPSERGLNSQDVEIIAGCQISQMRSLPRLKLIGTKRYATSPENTWLRSRNSR